MRPVPACAFLLLIFACVSPAQSYLQKHNFTVTAGAALPRNELRPFFSESFQAGAAYGYRFLPYLQADVGFDTVFQAARIQDFLPTEFGSLRIRDYQFFLPFGGRAILPLANDRIQIYGGGGGVYMRYTERLRQPFQNIGLTFDCPVCNSRSGIGYYAIAGGNIALDRGQHFRIGAGTRVVRGKTDGDPFGGVPSRETNDNWISIISALSVSF